ncbi:MAG: serpin family protein [Minicystis sp.]
MNFRRALPLAFPLALVMAGCSSSSDCTDPSTPGCVATSDKQRIEAPNVDDETMQKVEKGNSAFAMDLYQAIRTDPGNLFYSPYSISAALAMTFAGARNQTEEQMAKVLHFDVSQDKLHPAFNALDLALQSRGENAKGQDGGVFRLNIANALWGQTGYPFLAPFLDTLSQNYGAGMHVVDFVGAPEPARKLINEWVADKTEDRIKDLLPDGSIDSTTRLVLTNAIYFNAAWATPFDSANTKLADFTKRDGTKIQVQTMSGYQEAPYGEGDGWAAVEIPYDGHQLSMVLVLPSAGKIDDFEASLSGDKIAEITGKLTEHGVSMTLPRFKIESQFSLADRLSKMGMTDAFTGDADFSGMTGDRKLSISAVIHKAFVDVNEAGTEAAAATAVIAGETSAPEPAEIHLDRPYLFFIRDVATKTILFFGRVEDPAG